MSDVKEVLIIEDSSGKFDDIQSCLTAAVPSILITRAATMVEAEREIMRCCWDLVILDISMDIAPSRLGARGRGQANVGGLAIAHKMYLLNVEAPTIVVTAFDSFTAPAVGQDENEVMGFEDVARRAEEYLGSTLVACLRYNSSGWKESMVNSARSVIAQ